MKAEHFGPVLFREEAIFRREVRPGDTVYINLLVTKMRRNFSRYSFRHEITQADGSLCAVMNVDGASIDTKMRKLVILTETVGEKKNFNRFRKSALIKAAVERKIEIIGEAMNNDLQLDSNLAISNARRIVNTRNKIIHGYDEVDEVLIWEIVVKYLPILQQEVQLQLS